MPRLIVHSFTISIEPRVFRRACSGALLVVAFLLGGCKGDVESKVDTWNKRIAEHERQVDAAKGDSVVTDMTYDGRNVTYYIAGEKVKQEYYYHDRLVSCYNYSNGQLNGYGIEWDRTGTLYFVAHYVDGKLDGPSEQHERAFGFKTLQVYRMGVLLSSDTVPLTDTDSPHFERDVVKR